jgi:peptidyl-dipeptidase Dcp
VIESAAQQGQQQGKEGYLLGLDMPTYMAVMKYADRSELRAHFYRAYGSRAAKENENNNEQVIKDVVNKRMERAQLLGFDSHAQLTLSKRMAKTPRTVLNFLDHLLEVAKPAAERDLKAVRTLPWHRARIYPFNPGILVIGQKS